MALLNAQLEVKQMCGRRAFVLCFCDSAGRGMQSFLNADRLFSHARPTLVLCKNEGRFLFGAWGGWGVWRRDRTHKTGENRVRWGMVHQDYKNFHAVALCEKDVASCEKRLRDMKSRVTLMLLVQIAQKDSFASTRQKENLKGKGVWL